MTKGVRLTPSQALPSLGTKLRTGPQALIAQETPKERSKTFNSRLVVGLSMVSYLGHERQELASFDR